MSERTDRVKMARPGEAEAARTTIVGDIPRGVEVLVKKAAVDPAFKKTLLAKRGRAADDIALKLSPAETAILDAVPEGQLRAIIASTKVSPNLRPAFLGAVAAAMLAALASTAFAEDDKWELIVTGIDPGPDIPDTAYDYAGEIDVPEDAGAVTGFVLDEDGRAIPNALVEVIRNDTCAYAATADDGSFVVNNIPPGVYAVKVSSTRYEEQRLENVKIEAQTITNIKLILDELRIIPSPGVIAGIMPDTPPDKKGD